jgi:hypothetical protein
MLNSVEIGIGVCSLTLPGALAILKIETPRIAGIRDGCKLRMKSQATDLLQGSGDIAQKDGRGLRDWKS